MTVIPVPENWTAAGIHGPLVKLKPMTLTFSETAPRPIEKGTAAMP